MARQITRRLKLRLATVLAVCCLGLAGLSALALAAPSQAPLAPVKGLVTLVDLGATTCIPCRMMAPILEEVQREYKGRAAVVFIDVTKHNAVARSFGIRAIPTQIFYDKTGKEVARHEGFMDKKTLTAQLDKLLAK